MIVPQYWAEARVQHRDRQRRLTIRRYGWSDLSQEDAQRHADERAAEAMQRALAGESIPRRETKAAYNGAEGHPIREEVLERHGETVITRNLYGARCLNTPNVMFVDIDFQEQPSCMPCLVVLTVVILAAVAGIWWWHSVGVFVLLVFGTLFISSMLTLKIRKWWLRWQGGPEALARKTIDRFLEQHPDWRVRLYETPAGYRLLVMHRTFDPTDPETRESLQALRADPVYTRMCMNQHCFRARLTPKPWRMGIAQHMKPRPGIWPVAPDRLAERAAWIAEYEQKAQGYAACRFIEELGLGTTHPAAVRVQHLHDGISRATTPLPLA